MNPSPSSRSSSRSVRFLFWVSYGFWPLFAALTAVELRWNLGWFSPSNRFLWMPMAVFAFGCSAVAPVVTAPRGRRKITDALFSVGVFFFAYVIVLLVGLRYLRWDD